MDVSIFIVIKNILKISLRQMIWQIDLISFDS